MGIRIDPLEARKVLLDSFSSAEDLFSIGTPPSVSTEVSEACDRLFNSEIQAYREALLGCALAIVVDENIDIRKPQVVQGDNAFSGRSLDEKVVNPILVSKSIPCSKGPYLAVFRRSWQFVDRDGLKDQAVYRDMLQVIRHLELSAADRNQVLEHLAYRFLDLRERSQVAVYRLPDLSILRYENLLSNLFSEKSGGRLPVFATVAALKTLVGFRDSNKEVSFQGINEADAATGAGGDITVSDHTGPLLVVEVTERAIQPTRVESTYWTKIRPQNIPMYLFITKAKVSTETRNKAAEYSASCDICFLNPRDWIVSLLSVSSKEKKREFNLEVERLIDAETTPKSVKLAWNKAARNASP